MVILGSGTSFPHIGANIGDLPVAVKNLWNINFLFSVADLELIIGSRM